MKKIYIKHLVKPTYLAWGFGILAFIFMVQTMIVYVDGNKKVARTIEKFTYIKDRIQIDRINTESDRYSKVTKFYTEIVSTYFQKYRESYNKKDKWMYQGLNDRQLADIINLWYKGSRSIGISYMIMPSIALRESAGNPISRTYNKDETILEAGLYNNRLLAVMQATFYYSQMPTHLQTMFSFEFNKMEDLFDPVNATKIEFCLIWGEFRYFGGDPVKGLSAVHWGNHKIARLIHNGIYPPKDFKFNVGRINEDVRNPFVYYFIINQYISAFERFTVDVRLDKRYDTIYRNRCSKVEREYINSKRYFQDMIKLYEDEKQDNLDFNERRKIRDKKFQKKIENMNMYYIETQATIKSGNFRKLKDVYDIARLELKAFLKDINEEQNKSMKLQLKIISLSVVIILVVLFIFLLVFTIKYFYVRRKLK